MATTGPGYASDYYRALRANAAFGKESGSYVAPTSYRVAWVASAPATSNQILDELVGSGYSSPTIPNDTASWDVDDQGLSVSKIDLACGTSTATWTPSTGTCLVDPVSGKWLTYGPFVDESDNPITQTVAPALIVKLLAGDLQVGEA